MMRMNKFILTSILFLWFANAATAQAISALWVFGDSTVDTGWYINNKSGKTNYDYYMYMKQTAYGVGKPTSSPGKVSVEVLADALGVTAIPQNQTNGTNYATGGAKNVRHNAATADGFTNAVPTVTQLENYLANGNTASDTALYLISSGDNDVAFVLKHPGTDAKIYLTNAANSLANEIHALTQGNSHAKYILVVGLPESFGKTTAQKSFRAFYNQELYSKLTSFPAPFSFLWVDANGVRALMESYKSQPPSPFGITNYKIGDPTTCTANTTCSACPLPTPDPMVQPPINEDWAYVCSTMTSAPSIPSNGKGSEWADDNHYATGGQSVLGTYFYCAANKYWSGPLWPTNPNLPFPCKNFSNLLQHLLP